VLFGALAACCSSNGKCGNDVGPLAPSTRQTPPPSICVEQHQPGVRDDTCPSTTITIGQRTLAGCCRPDGHCGFLADEVPAPDGGIEMQNLGCLDANLLGVEAPPACGAPIADR
jgi:hypothetical protein